MKGYYDFKAIEKKWQERWKAESHPVDLDKGEKFYCLDMFPYPSGKGLHVGHWRGYVLSDFYARYWQLNGKNVFHPMGFDSFGLPAENAAIKNSSHPKEYTDEAIEEFKSQLSQTGASYNWEKTLSTCDPEYYRWTQWLFLQLFKHGFAEKRLAEVNWCPKDQTVLANEQVANGKCDRCGTTVTKKKLSQWFLKITDYADELLESLDDLDWPDHVKELQRNWIGRSVGALISFACEGSEIQAFTTRADTLFGVSAIVLSPEHPLVEKLTTAEQGDKVKKYILESSAKSYIDREQEAMVEKSGVFTGAMATHPLSGKNLPVWVADYVLPSYGTGAVMSVPAHDERDWLFSQKYGLPVVEVVRGGEGKLPYTGEGELVNSPGFDGETSEVAMRRITQALEKIGKGKASVSWRLRDWLVSRQRYWGAPVPIVYDPNGEPHMIKEEHLPLLLPDDVSFEPTGESPIAKSKEYVERVEKLYGEGWRFDTDTLDTFVDSSWYFFRYLSPADDKQAIDRDLVSRWLPVDLYIGGVEHATMHLLYARFISRFLATNGYIAKDLAEPFKKLYNIGTVNLHGSKMSKSKGNIVTADELVERVGADTLRGYELFLGPMDMEVEWNSRGVMGVHRFLIKLVRLSEHVSNEDLPSQREAFGSYLQKIAPMIKEFRLNTVIAQAMTLVNVLEKDEEVSISVWRELLVTLSPIFPHLTEELWEKLGEKKSIFTASWPRAVAASSEHQKVKVLINQKFFDEMEVDSADGPTVERLLLENLDIRKKLGTRKVDRIIVRESGIVNIVAK